VPFAEQSKELVAGERQPIGLYLDRSRRLAGTMYVSDLFGDRRRVVRDEWIEGEAWRNDPDIGLFVILERAFVGLVPAREPHALERGQAARFRVAETLPDGKLVLSLRQHAYQELAADAANILAVLARPRAPEIGDRSDPEAIRALFGLSKKAFKRAIGHLLKQGAVTIDARGFVVPAPKAR
jgi:predicted RNA-binding protein (virulence factor B family)